MDPLVYIVPLIVLGLIAMFMIGHIYRTILIDEEEEILSIEASSRNSPTTINSEEGVYQEV